MTFKTKVLLGLVFVAGTVITIVISNAGVDDQPSKERPPYQRAPYVPDDDDYFCYEQIGGDGYPDIVCD